MSLKQRVEARLRDLGLNAFEAARNAGLERNFINDILNEKKKSVSGAKLKRLSDVLACDTTYLTLEQDSPTLRIGDFKRGGIPVVGVAEAGVFRDSADLGTAAAPDTYPQISASRSRLYPDARHFALQIRGNSMNAATPHPILDGMVALCIDLKSADLRVETGKLYVVKHSRDRGVSWEISIRRAKVFSKHVEFHSESISPIAPLVAPPKGHDITEAVALVYFHGTNLEP